MSKKYIQSIKMLFKKVELGSNDSPEEVNKKLIGKNSILYKGLAKILENKEVVFDEQENMKDTNNDDGTSKKHRFKKKIESVIYLSGTYNNLKALQNIVKLCKESKNLQVLSTTLDLIYKKEITGANTFTRLPSSFDIIMLSPFAGIRRVKKEALELKKSIDDWIKKHPNK